MVQVQVRIFAGEDNGLRVDIDILSREDANDTEKSLAKSIEKILIWAGKKAATSAGGILEVTKIKEE